MEKPDIPERRSIVAKVVLGLAVVSLLALASLGGWVAYQVYQFQAFRGEYERIQAVVATWDRQRPAEVDPLVWEQACFWSGVGVANVCFSTSHVPLDEMQRLRADVEAAAAGPITLETHDWLWLRLGQTGPHGAEYTRRMSVLRDEELAAGSGP